MNANKIVHLVPPVLDAATLALGQEIRCTRPFREGMFEISVAKRENKTIVNCYGMGGAGWTTMPGDVQEAITLFEAQGANKDIPIRVVGAGCLGLRTALDLTDRGYKVAGITAKEFYAIPSWQAAGYYALVSIKTSPEQQARLDQIHLTSFKAYQEVEQGACPYLSTDCVRMLPVYSSKDTVSGVEELATEGFIPPGEKVTLDFGNGVIHENFVKYMTYFMDTSKLMKQMTAEVKRREIPMTHATLNDFSECQESVVFNCAGLGARELSKDQAVSPVRGHMIMLNERSGIEHMNYMIYTKVMQHGKEEYVYLFPKNLSVTHDCPEGRKCQGALGGTFVHDTEKLSPSELEKLDEVEFKKIIERSRDFFYGMKHNI